jgi:hypothetical protein
MQDGDGCELVTVGIPRSNFPNELSPRAGKDCDARFRLHGGVEVLAFGSPEAIISGRFNRFLLRSWLLALRGAERGRAWVERVAVAVAIEGGVGTDGATVQDFRGRQTIRVKRPTTRVR